jgi:hypothetical protein
MTLTTLALIVLTAKCIADAAIHIATYRRRVDAAEAEFRRMWGVDEDTRGAAIRANAVQLVWNVLCSLAGLVALLVIWATS